jgi:HSP20 family protein
MTNLPSKNRNPYSPLISIQDRMNDLFDSFFQHQISPWNFGFSANYPAISVSEKDKCVYVKAEIPSIDEKDIKIDINKNLLTISGEKRSENSEESSTYHVCEISYGKFSRSISLPFEIDSSKTKANFSKGVLTIEIQKPEQQIAKSQNIPIKFEK